MTIAAGFLYDQGVLITADSLMSSDTMSLYESKLMVHHFIDGMAVFGMAGNIHFAESAVQECEEALVEHSGKPRTVRQIAKAIRDILSRYYKIHVIDNQLQYSHSYNFVIAIRSSVDGVGLYVTEMTAMKETRRGFECVGSGHDLAHFLIGQLYEHERVQASPWEKYVSKELATLLAFNAMAHIRSFMPGSVGGNPTFVIIPKDEAAHAILGSGGYPVIDFWLRTLDSNARRLMLTFFRAKTGEEFSKELARFSSTTLRAHDLWKEQMSAANQHQEKTGIRFTSSELELTLRLAAIKDPTSPKRDRKSPQPSPE